MKTIKRRFKNEGLTDNENCSVFDTQKKDIETSREKFNKIMQSKLVQSKENAGVKDVKTSNIDDLTKRGKEMRKQANIKESKVLIRRNLKRNSLHESENTTSKCTLSKGEKCLATRGYTSLIKTEDGKYVTKYAPGYKNGEIKAKDDKEAINKFLNEARINSSPRHRSMMDVAKESPMRKLTSDKIFEIVDHDLNGDGVAIQVDNRVFICEIEDLPEGGVPDNETFKFKGCEVTSSDIEKVDGKLMMQDCEEEKSYEVVNGKIVKEKLTESPMRNLEPVYDSRKSFYGKARVETDYPEKDSKVLYSYSTPVVGVRDGKVTLLRNGYLGWASSSTTLRHVKDFLRQEGFASGSYKDLMKMYPVQQFDSWKRHEEIVESKESSKEKLTGRVLKKKETIECVNEESKKLTEGYLGQTLEDFLGVCVEPDMGIQKIVLCDINEDDFDDSICFNGTYDELTDAELNYEFHEFDTFGEGVTINVGVASGDDYYSTVQDFLDDCNEDNITIYDLDKDEVVFEGDKYEIPDDVLDMEFASFDAPKKITINVTCGDEDYEDDEEEFDSYDEDDSFDSIDESLKITSDISSYKPWSGAVETFEKIKDAGMVDDLDFLLEDMYPDGITETQLNDILWFDADWVLESLGLKEEEFEDDYE